MDLPKSQRLPTAEMRVISSRWVTYYCHTYKWQIPVPIMSNRASYIEFMEVILKSIELLLFRKADVAYRRQCFSLSMTVIWWCVNTIILWHLLTSALQKDILKESVHWYMCSSNSAEVNHAYCILVLVLITFSLVFGYLSFISTLVQLNTLFLH